MTPRRSFALAALLWAGLASAAPAANLARVGLPAADYQRWLDQLKAKGYRPALVDVHVHERQPLFSAVAVRDALEWAAEPAVSADDFQEAFTERVKKGYRLVGFSRYVDGKERVAVLWARGGRDGGWLATPPRLTAAQYRRRQDDAVERGLRPAVLQGYPTAAGTRHAAVFHEAGSAAWVARVGLTAAECRALVDDHARRSYHVAHASAVVEDGTPRFNIVLVQSPGVESVVRFGRSAADFAQETEQRGRQGYQPVVVAGHSAGGASRYLGVWQRRRPLPVTGRAVPELVAFDEAMLLFMAERGFHCGTLAVMKDGRLVLSRGYGYATPDGSRAVEPDVPLRLASVTKSLTAMLVRKLIAEKKLAEDTRAFAYLGVTPPEGQKADPRLKDVTIRHLLDHEGGWDSSVGPLHDPVFQAERIGKALGLKGPATAADVVRYMAGQPLQAAPGTRYAYSNFGYCVLGRVVEKATGRTYADHLRRELAPLGVRSIDLGRTLVAQRHPREPHYFDLRSGRNVVTGSGAVAAPDGTFSLEAVDSAGGLIGSAPDVARYLHAYWLNGTPRRGGGEPDCYFGSIPGTWAMARQRLDGVNIVALFNQRAAPPGRRNATIRALLDRAADGVKRWP